MSFLIELSINTTNNKSIDSLFLFRVSDEGA